MVWYGQLPAPQLLVVVNQIIGGAAVVVVVVVVLSQLLPLLLGPLTPSGSRSVGSP